MRFFMSPRSSSVVGITITPRTITCSWIESTPSKSLPYTLKAYKHILYEIHQKNTLVLYNPTRIRSLLFSFLALYDLEDAAIVMALSGQGVTEKQVMLTKPTADLADIENEDSRVWHYYCLHDNPNTGQAPWYCCSIDQPLLFQYVVLALYSRLNLVQITTPTMALLKAYKFIKKSSSENTKTTIMELVNLNGHLRIKSPHEHAALVESLGLHLLGNERYEKH